MSFASALSTYAFEKFSALLNKNGWKVSSVSNFGNLPDQAV
jgi:hypothetical protein